MPLIMTNFNSGNSKVIYVIIFSPLRWIWYHWLILMPILSSGLNWEDKRLFALGLPAESKHFFNFFIVKSVLKSTFMLNGNFLVFIGRIIIFLVPGLSLSSLAGFDATWHFNYLLAIACNTGCSQVGQIQTEFVFFFICLFWIIFVSHRVSVV